MILDSLKNLPSFFALNGLFPKAYEFLSIVQQRDFPVGKFPIEDDLLFAIVEETHGKGTENCRLEAHRKYIDIHYVISGIDTIGWLPLNHCRTIDQAYSRESDKIFFKDRPSSWLSLEPGFVCICFPEDAHAPLAGDGHLKKVILKVLFQPEAAT
jgi:YhcH/YjgK/YiaL family protein